MANRPLTNIGEVIRNGVVFDFKNWQGGTVNADHLPDAVAHLFSLFETNKVDYVLVGGIALLQYVEGRNTQDIDFIVEKSAVERLRELKVTAWDEFFARADFEGLRVDLLLMVHPLFNRVRQAYSTVRPFEGREIRCATVEGLLLLKLFALPSLYRGGNLDKAAIYEGDVLMLLTRSKTDPENLLAELAPHVSSSDLSEIRKIVQELRQRIERMQHWPEQSG